MRTLCLFLLASLVLALAPPSASAHHCEGDACPCPTYDQGVTASRTSVEWNDDNQARVTLGDSPLWEVRYVTVDEVVLLTPHARDAGWLFYIGIHPEANGEDGLQRHEEYCSDCPEWDSCPNGADVIIA